MRNQSIWQDEYLYKAIIYLTKNIVIFPSNFGARGFVYTNDDKGWIEINNKIIIYPETGEG